MTGFLIGAAAAVALVFTLLLRPFLGKAASSQSSRRELNAAIFREQLVKLEQDLAEGTLGKQDYAQARAELQRRVLEDTREEDAARTLRAPRRTMAAVGLILPLAAGALYLLIGNPAGMTAFERQEALKANPDHPMSLWLSGKADLEARNYAQALRTWERLAALLPPGSDDARMLQGAIGYVRARAGPAAKAPAVAAVGNVSGTVDLDPSLKGKAGPDDTVMVIARLPGTRMPLAAVRFRAAELPVKFILDDSQSMNPQSPISAAAEVEVEARISKTGLAKAEPGDLVSAVQTVKVGARGVALRVARVRR